MSDVEGGLCLSGSGRVLTTLLFFRVTGDALRLSSSPPLSHLANGQPLQSYKLNVVRRLLRMERLIRKGLIGIRKAHKLSWPLLESTASIG